MNGHSFTAGTTDRVYAAALAGFREGSTDTLLDFIAPKGTTVREADGEDGTMESGSNTGNTIVVIVDVDSERAAPQWSVIDGIGVFSGSFLINCNGAAGAASGESKG